MLKPVAEEVGFRFWKPIVWDKVTMGMGYHYRARYEFVLFFEKGKRRLNDLSVPDVLGFKRVRNGYPAEKPLELIQTLNHAELRGRRARPRSILRVGHDDSRESSARTRCVGHGHCPSGP